MNEQREFDRAVDRWLDDGSDATPPEVIAAVLLAVKSTPQERDLRILRRIEPVMMYLRVAAVFVAVAVAGLAGLYAFGSGPGVGSLPTPNATPHSDDRLGVFDLEAFEGRFEVELVAETVSASGNIQYAAVDDLDVNVDEEVGLHFTVDPNNAISGTGITSRLPDHNPPTVDEWLAFLGETQPDAAEWLASERAAYLAAPGAQVSLGKEFGGLCAGLITSPPTLEPDGDVNSIYMFADYQDDCPDQP